MRRKANDFVVALVRLFGPFGPKPAERVLRASAGGGIRLARLNKIQTAFGFVFGLFDFGYAQDTFASGMLK